MNRNTLLPLLLAAVVIVPTAVAGFGQQMDSTQQLGSGIGSQAESDSSYTELYIDSQHRSLELGPGDSKTVSVTVENGEDDAVRLTPRLFTPGIRTKPIPDSWVTIEDRTVTLDGGETTTINATVEVPDDAETRRYVGALAFTNETVSYPGRPAYPVHSATLDVEVVREPTVTVNSGSHGYVQAKTGDATTHEVVIENSGDQAIPLNPQLSREEMYDRGGRSKSVEPSWFDISAPSEVEAGETVTVEVTVAPPADAERGRYDTQLDLGLRDPARSPDDDYWQQVDLSLEVWEQPTEPFEREITVDEDTEQMTLTLSTYDRRPSGTTATPSFNVTFVSPNGTTVDAQRVERSTSGDISLAEPEEATELQHGVYGTDGSEETFVYRVEDPAAGTWTAEILPENVIEFDYEVTRTESSD